VIRVPLSYDDLWQEIDGRRPSWRAKAGRLALANETAQRHVGEENIWSEIKPIFVRRQRAKCAYCERRLGSAAIEWDVEHFRPKGGVDAWASPTGVIRRSGKADSAGYYLLAFDPRNYLVACSACNTSHKRNFFPVRRRRTLSSRDPVALRNEDAYLLNPLDQDDEDPEELIHFYGVTPRPASRQRGLRARATVTIEVLGLMREDLESDRAEVIMHLWNAILLRDTHASAGDPIREQAERSLRALSGEGSPHANCARSFLRLCETNRGEAAKFGDAATKKVESYSD
jgi:hypothetical protein